MEPGTIIAQILGIGLDKSSSMNLFVRLNRLKFIDRKASVAGSGPDSSLSQLTVPCK